MALPDAFFFSKRHFEWRRVHANLYLFVFLRNGNALSVQIEARKDVHRRRHVVLRHLAGADEIRHRRENVRAVDAVRFPAKDEIVARGAP